MLLAILILSSIQLMIQSKVKEISREEQTIRFWKNNGHGELQKKLKEIQNKHFAKNIILFIGDGMGPATLAVARIYKNQLMINSTSPDIGLTFDSFSNAGVVKTHSIDDYVADSSSTATAILTGVKIRSQVVGTGPNVYFENCSSHDPKNDNLESIGTMFYKKNRSVGIVTTARITHATPASLYAHSASRNWESKVPVNCSKDDIALQLFKKAEQFKVILGGGSTHFVPNSLNGSRLDGRNLLSEWEDKMKPFRGHLIRNITEFKKLDILNTDYLFGLLSKSHLDYDTYRKDQPSLAELTDVAIKILNKDKNGYFLLVEGGRIDHAHHKSKAKLAILETLALEKAVEQAMKSTSFDDTLIMVTADHSHVFTVGSYAHREVDITKRNHAMAGKELDKKGHTSLLYSNGPGFQEPRVNITDAIHFARNHIYSSGVPFTDETHGGEDITVYAEGPWGHLLNGLHQQSYIAYVMMYASCTGKYDNADHCNTSNVVKHNKLWHLIMLSFIKFYFM